MRHGYPAFRDGLGGKSANLTWTFLEIQPRGVCLRVGHIGLGVEVHRPAQCPKLRLESINGV